MPQQLLQRDTISVSCAWSPQHFLQGAGRVTQPCFAFQGCYPAQPSFLVSRGADSGGSGQAKPGVCRGASAWAVAALAWSVSSAFLQLLVMLSQSSPCASTVTSSSLHSLAPSEPEGWREGDVEGGNLRLAELCKG